MQPDEFNRIIQQYDNQIKALQQEKEFFIYQNRKEVLKIVQLHKNENKKWFVENFDKIWKHRKNFSLGTPYASIIINFWTIYLYARCGSGFAVNKISLGRLIKLWELGFMYEGYPIVQYFNTSANHYVMYIKNNKLCKQQVSSKDPSLFFSKLLMKLLQESYQFFGDNEFTDYKSAEEIQAVLTCLGEPDLNRVGENF